MNTDRWYRIPWSCAQCKKLGTAPKVYSYPDEQYEQTARRFQNETRERCVTGCRFVAWSFDVPAGQAPATP